MACRVRVPELGYVFRDANRGKVDGVRRWRGHRGLRRSKRGGIKPDVTAHGTRAPPETNELLSAGPEVSGAGDPEYKMVKRERRGRIRRRRRGFVEAEAVGVRVGVGVGMRVRKGKGRGGENK